MVPQGRPLPARPRPTALPPEPTPWERERCATRPRPPSDPDVPGRWSDGD
jgi:hypothetical protein